MHVYFYLFITLLSSHSFLFLYSTRCSPAKVLTRKQIRQKKSHCIVNSWCLCRTLHWRIQNPKADPRWESDNYVLLSLPFCLSIDWLSKLIWCGLQNLALVRKEPNWYKAEIYCAETILTTSAVQHPRLAGIAGAYCWGPTARRAGITSVCGAYGARMTNLGCGCSIWKLQEQLSSNKIHSSKRSTLIH